VISNDAKINLIKSIDYAIGETMEMINKKHIHSIAGFRIIDAIEEIRFIVQQEKEESGGLVSTAYPDGNVVATYVNKYEEIRKWSGNKQK